MKLFEETEKLDDFFQAIVSCLGMCVDDLKMAVLGGFEDFRVLLNRVLVSNDTDGMLQGGAMKPFLAGSPYSCATCYCWAWSTRSRYTARLS